MTANPKSDKFRNREIGLIHQGATALGMDTKDDNPNSEYRTMLHSLTGYRSTAKLNSWERKKVLDHLKTRGWAPKAKTRPAPAADRAHLVRKIQALLINHHSGRKPDAYADALARRMFNVECYVWCNAVQLRGIIGELEQDKDRHSDPA